MPLRHPTVPENGFFCFFLALYDKISKVSISQELCITLKWLTIQNDQKTHLSISVSHNIYIKNQWKWENLQYSPESILHEILIVN